MANNNNNNNQNVSSGGITFTGLLTIAFIVLKLCNVINWSWVWVLSPLWLGLAVFLGLAIIVFVIGLIVNLFR